MSTEMQRQVIEGQLAAMPEEIGGKGFWTIFCILLFIIGAGICAYLYQVVYGLTVTGLSHTVFWGFYIMNFVFFIGISHAGTLISAILRLTGAEWRRPVTRVAEAITAFSIMVAGTMILADMGRPDRLLNMISHGRVQSPLLWDLLSVSSYLFSSSVYLFLPLIPDIALMRDKLTSKGWRWALYNLLSLNWKGTDVQRARLEKAISAMAIMIIPLAVSVHTVVAYVFAMTLRPMWHSTIMGPYFVIGAIFSGLAALLIVMAIVQKSLRLEGVLKEIHFQYLSNLLLVFFGAWFYGTICEYLVTGYGGASAEMRVLSSKMLEEHTWMFWTMIFCMAGTFFILTPWDWVVKRLRLPVATVSPWHAFPLMVLGWVGVFMTISFTPGNPLLWVSGVAYLILFFLILVPSLRQSTVSMAVSASLLVLVGMWLERYSIVVPTLTRPMLEYIGDGSYTPTWVEICITFAGFSAVGLLFMIFSKLFPLISIWEVCEAEEDIPAIVAKLTDEATLPASLQHGSLINESLEVKSNG